VFVSDDALVLGFALRDGQAGRFSVRRRDGGEVAAEHSSPSAVAFRDPISIRDLQAIAIQTAGDLELKTSLVLQLNVAGTVFPLDVPIALRPMSALQDAVKFGGVAAARELVDHLEANRFHYSQAVYRALDATAIAAALALFTYRGLPLAQVVDPQPVAVSANFLVFRVSVSATGRSEDARWAAEETAWREWLARHGLERPVPKTEIIPLPSGGVFAEAVLGRYNAAEKIDLQRFWNWQDSPIPLTAPDIAPLQAGSRAQPEDLQPGQLSPPVVNIQAPAALPDPAGVAAILAAIQNGTMFRDMSGLAQTAALAQAALLASAQGATAAGQQAGQNMKTVVDAQTERMRIAAQLATAMLGPGAGGRGTGAPGRGTVSERGGELNVAEDIDARRSPEGTTPAPIADGSGGTEPGPTELEQTFRSQRDGPPTMARLTDALLADFAGPDEGGGGGSSPKPRPRPRQRAPRTVAFNFAFKVKRGNAYAVTPATPSGFFRYTIFTDDGEIFERPRTADQAFGWTSLPQRWNESGARYHHDTAARQVYIGIEVWPYASPAPPDDAGDLSRYCSVNVKLNRPPKLVYVRGTTLVSVAQEIVKPYNDTLDRAAEQAGIRVVDITDRHMVELPGDYGDGRWSITYWDTVILADPDPLVHY
jgi:hypothetical protein